MKIEFEVIMPKKGALEKQAWEALKQQTTEWLETSLKNVKCPDHHEHPRVIVSGSMKNMKFKIKGCCQKLEDEAAEALK